MTEYYFYFLVLLELGNHYLIKLDFVFDNTLLILTEFSSETCNDGSNDVYARTND